MVMVMVVVQMVMVVVMVMVMVQMVMVQMVAADEGCILGPSMGVSCYNQYAINKYTCMCNYGINTYKHMTMCNYGGQG